MANTAEAATLFALPVDDQVLARLHALACFHCGSTFGPLIPAGHVYTGGGGGRYGWPVVACREHQEESCGH